MHLWELAPNSLYSVMAIVFVSNRKLDIALKIALAFVALSVAMIPAIHFSLIRSDAFIAAKSFLQDSHQVKSQFGLLRSIELSWSGESSVTESGNGGHSILSMEIVGSVDSGIAQVNLEKTLGAWNVTKASVRSKSNGSTVALK